MCRHLAYLGPELKLPELLFDKPHSLLHQTWAPGDMRGGGTVNVDGFGVGARGCGALASPTQECHREGAEPVLGDRAAAARAPRVRALLNPAQG